MVVQNAVSPDAVGTATSTNNYFREVGAALGVAVFGTIFTSRLSEALSRTFTDFGASPAEAGTSTASLSPQLLSALPAQLKDAIVNAYADSLAPVFWCGRQTRAAWMRLVSSRAAHSSGAPPNSITSNCSAGAFHIPNSRVVCST